MLIRIIFPILLLFLSFLPPGKSFLFPLLFPLSIRITFHTNHKHTPAPKPDYHYPSIPVYKEVVMKGGHKGYKQSYGDGQKYGTSYGDGHVKVYTNEPHIQNHMYSSGYGSKPSYPPPSHYEDIPYHDGHGSTIIKGSLTITSTDPHHKGYESPHYPAPPHIKGTPYVDPYPDVPYVSQPPTKDYHYIKSVGGYKLSDYLPAKGSYDGSHVAVPYDDGLSFAEIEAAHKVSHTPKAYDAKEYADLGHKEYSDYDERYLDDSLPSLPYAPSQYAKRSGKSAQTPSKPKAYAGFGTSVYGDSYAKIVYTPKRGNLKITLQKHKR